MLEENIINKNNISDVLNYINKKEFCTVFGKGPSFINLPKKENEFRIAVNQAGNILEDVDMIVMNDLHNYYNIDDNVYKKLKYLLVPNNIHVQIKDTWGVKKKKFTILFDHLKDKFFGKLIIFNLNTSTPDDNYIYLNSACSSGNNAVDFVAQHTNIKNLQTYGIGIFDETIKYHEKFTGRGAHSYHPNRIQDIKNNIKDICNKFDVTFKIN